VLAVLLALAAGCRPAQRSPERPRVVVLGLDGMDHGIVAQMITRGELPELARLARDGGFRALETSVPPQSPTAWSNFITGKGPGYHGIFDFVHRDPATMEPYLSTSRASDPARLTLGSLALPLGSGRVELLRGGTPLWRYLSRAGVPAEVIRIPSHFPPEDDGEARVLSGMGTPDLLGTYGTFTICTTDRRWLEAPLSGGRAVRLERVAGDRYAATLEGPDNPLSAEGRPLTLRLELALSADGEGALVTLGETRALLGAGEWSPFVPLSFSYLGGLEHVRGVVRLYLKALSPAPTLYISPLNIDPLDPALPISSPPDFAADLARRAGRFYTQGMPEDTKALASGFFSREEFLRQAGLVLTQRKRLMESALDDLDARGGFLFFYYSSSDQITHMFFRAHDRTHPARTAADEPFADVLEQTYRELDAVVGRVRARLRPDDLLLVMSDHGFGPAAYLFDLNGWLAAQGYLVPRQSPGPGVLGHIDWSRTQAYGLGLNGLYLNLRGREREGVVSPARRDELLARIQRGLLALRHPVTGRRVVTEVTRPDRTLRGPRLADAPDLIVGYARGFKVADASATGGVGQRLFQINHSPWSGDHCGDHRLVPGILFANRKLRGGNVSLLDLAPTILGALGVDVPTGMAGRSVLAAGKQEETHVKDQDR